MTRDERRHAICEAGGIACDCGPCLAESARRRDERIRAEARREALRDAIEALWMSPDAPPCEATDVAEETLSWAREQIEALMAKEGDRG